MRKLQTATSLEGAETTNRNKFRRHGNYAGTARTNLPTNQQTTTTTTTKTAEKRLAFKALMMSTTETGENLDPRQSVKKTFV